jgi:hypothetical protein
MDEKTERRIAELVADWPPLSEELKEQLARVLQDEPPPGSLPDQNPRLAPSDAGSGVFQGNSWGTGGVGVRRFPRSGP